MKAIKNLITAIGLLIATLAGALWVIACALVALWPLWLVLACFKFLGCF